MRLGRWLLCLSVILAAAATASCGRGTSEPTIGFTYNWGDVNLERFVAEELERARPEGAVAIRLRTSSEGGWQAFGASPLAAEIGRATALAADSNVLAVVGPGGSREVLQVARVYAEAELGAIIPTATARLLAESGPLIFRMAADDSVQGAFITAFADSALGARRLAIFHTPDEYGIGLAAGTASTAAGRGIAVMEQSAVRLVQPCRSTEERAYYATLVSALAASGKPDVVVMATRTQETTCLTRALRAQWKDVTLIAGDGAYVDEALANAAASGTGALYLVAFWHRDIGNAKSREFVAAFERSTGRPPRHGEAMFTDGVLLAAAAIWDGADSRDDVLRYLRELGTTRPAFQGITGAISFAPGAPHPLWMTRVDSGAPVLVRR